MSMYLVPGLDLGIGFNGQILITDSNPIEGATVTLTWTTSPSGTVTVTDETPDEGDNVTLEFIPTEYTYQWYKNTILLVGETNQELVLSPVQLSDNGQYTVEVTNTTSGISKVFGPRRLTVIAAPRLLDSVTTVAAFSTRKLRTNYTGNCVKVRRSSDNTEQDIGFTNNILDTAALLSFCGTGNGYVSIWYEQSDDGRNVVQPVTSKQPQIVSSGSVITENGKPTLQFDGTDDYLQYSNTLPVTSASVFCVYNQSIFANYCVIATKATDGDYFFYIDTNGYIGVFSFNRRSLYPSAMPDTGRVLYESYHTGIDMTVYINNISKGTNSSQAFDAGTMFRLGASEDNGRFLNGKLSEVIVLPNNIQATRTTLVNGINSYWAAF